MAITMSKLCGRLLALCHWYQVLATEDLIPVMSLLFLAFHLWVAQSLCPFHFVRHYRSDT